MDAAIAAAVIAGTASWDNGGWIPAGEPAVAAAPEPAPAVAGDVPGMSAAGPVLDVPPAMPENVATVPGTLLDILATVWEDTNGFEDIGDADDAHWRNVAMSLEQHNVDVNSRAPARNLNVSWNNWLVWGKTCWYCGKATNPPHTPSRSVGPTGKRSPKRFASCFLEEVIWGHLQSATANRPPRRPRFPTLWTGEAMRKCWQRAR